MTQKGRVISYEALLRTWTATLSKCELNVMLSEAKYCVLRGAQILRSTQHDSRLRDDIS